LNHEARHVHAVDRFTHGVARVQLIEGELGALEAVHADENSIARRRLS
jgi:hypothetical protein